MPLSPRYWNIYRPTSTGRQSYEPWPSPVARSHLERHFASFQPSVSNWGQETDIQTALLSCFKQQTRSGQQLEHQAKSGLCLRCYVSHPILRACRELAYLFSRSKQVKTDLLSELLSVTLNDDGQVLVLLNSSTSKIQYIVGPDQQLQPTEYRLFTVEILQKFNPDLENRLSLENWAYYLTRQHEQVQRVLSEVGFLGKSDWALLNQRPPKHCNGLTDRDFQLIAAFQSVYQRDRLLQQQTSTQPASRKCLPPSPQQLDEMLATLSGLELGLNYREDLLKSLRQIATQLRQYRLWCRRGTPQASPLEITDPETGEVIVRQDLPPQEATDPAMLEQKELLQFLEQKLLEALRQGIKQTLCDRRLQLSQGRRAAQALKFIPALRLLYVEALSQREIVQRLDFTNQAQVSRLLSPRDLLNQVRCHTLNLLLDKILQKAKQLGLTTLPPLPDYLENLCVHLEAFIDAEIFTLALTELQAGQNRRFNSVYAQCMSQYLQQH